MLSRADNSYLVEKIDREAKPAGYPGLMTAQDWQDDDDPTLAKLRAFVESEWNDEVHLAWGTKMGPGAVIGKHAHHRPTVVYYPRTHPNGTWLEDHLNGELLTPADERSFAYIREGQAHWVEPNETDEVRYTVVFTLATRGKRR